jgi:NitT/TauT family transport system substrate-binding protein
MKQVRSVLGGLMMLGAALGMAVAPALAQSGLAQDVELVETRHEAPKLAAAATYAPQNGVIDVELSEYAGYAGLIVANGGMEPNDQSLFTKKYGFKVRLTLSEEESWSALNKGRMAASATTVDVLAVYGKQFQVTVPALIGFSRGADGIVVRSDIRRINDLAGQVVASAQFTEADFFLRYLAQEAGVPVNMLEDLAGKPDPKKINVVYGADAFGAGDLFLRDLQAGRNRLAGCVTWAPKTTEVVEASGGKARLLVTNTNLLIVADILIVNKGFAQANPEVVRGLVQGLLEGNEMVRTDPAQHLPVIAKALGWTPQDAKAELAKVHLANLPENQGFFNGTIDAAGSFGFIYETAAYVYGHDLIGTPPEGERFVDTTALVQAQQSGLFKNQKASIMPIRLTEHGVEQTGDAADEEKQAILSKSIIFAFEPNSSKLQLSKDNDAGLASIARLLQISPGSKVLLRGHADGSRLPEFRKQGGETKARQMSLVLKNLSRARCVEIRQLLEDHHKLDAARVETQGVGAEEPTGEGPDRDRRVEVQWFTLE